MALRELVVVAVELATVLLLELASRRMPSS